MFANSCASSISLPPEITNSPVAVRGSGLDKTGSDLSSGLVISTERLNQIQEIDVRDRLVRVQAGVTLEHLIPPSPCTASLYPLKPTIAKPLVD